MLFSRGFSRFWRAGLNHCRWWYASPAAGYCRLISSNHRLGHAYSNSKVLGCEESYSSDLWLFHQIRCRRIHHSATSTYEEPADPFSLVADELSLLANRLRSMVVTEVPKLASAAEYFFKMGVEGKKFRPTVLLLMATALSVPVPISSTDGVSTDRVVDTLAVELRTKQQCLAEITEMIHVASLLHDDVLNDAETRRGINSLNSVMGNKVPETYIRNSQKVTELLKGSEKTLEVKHKDGSWCCTLWKLTRKLLSLSLLLCSTRERYLCGAPTSRS